MNAPRTGMVNPFLALASLYKKDGKDFKDVISDIRSSLAEFGLVLEPSYTEEKVMPWLYALIFMSAGSQMLDQYVSALSNVASRRPPDGKPPIPPPPLP